MGGGSGCGRLWNTQRNGDVVVADGVENDIARELGSAKKGVYDFSLCRCQFATLQTRMNARTVFTTLFAHNTSAVFVTVSCAGQCSVF
jgi:hypothetical protein